MKNLVIILLSVLFVSCSQISQKVTYNQTEGLCVETYTNGLRNHGYEDFHIKQSVEPHQVDSVKKLQMQIAEEYLKIADQ